MMAAMRGAMRVSALLFVPLISLACVSSEGVDGDGCALTEPRGVVNIEAFAGGGYDGLRVTLGFQRQTPPREALNCTHRVVGACTLTTCLARPIDFADGEPTCPGATAGVVQVRRASGAVYATATGTQFSLAPPPAEEESLAVRSTGAIVPAFDGRVALPPRLTVTSPTALRDGAGLRIHAGEALPLRWTPVSSRVIATLYGSSNGFTAECTFDGSTGEGAIPVEALGEAVSFIDVTTLNESHLDAGPYPITLQARWASTARSSVSVAP